MRQPLPIDVETERVRPLKRVEYERLVDSGAFEDERIELLVGRLVEMAPQGSRHVETVKRLNRLLVSSLGSRADVIVQGPLAISDDSEPEPDLSVVESRDYSEELPRSAWLVIEVADSSARRDRTVKSDIYAAAHVEVYWLVDLSENLVEVRSDPFAGSYRSLTTLRAGDTLSLSRFPDVQIPVADLLR